MAQPGVASASVTTTELVKAAPAGEMPGVARNAV